jgi:hypothetical protein
VPVEVPRGAEERGTFTGGKRKCGCQGPAGNGVPMECGVLCECWAAFRVPDYRYCNGPTVTPEGCPLRQSQQPMPFRVSIRMTREKGWGLFADEDIPKKAYIGCYGGEAVTVAESEERQRSYADQNLMASYIFDLWGGSGSQKTKSNAARYCLDAQVVRNATAFLNHSCAPNVEAKYVLPGHRDKNMGRLCFFAAANVAKDEELCFRYEGDVRKKFGERGCRCDKCVAAAGEGW